LPEVKNIENSLIKMHNFRHILYNQSDPNLEFIKKFENIKNYFISKKESLKQMLKELKDIQ